MVGLSKASTSHHIGQDSKRRYRRCVQGVGRERQGSAWPGIGHLLEELTAHHWGKDSALCLRTRTASGNSSLQIPLRTNVSHRAPEIGSQSQALRVREAAVGAG